MRWQSTSGGKAKEMIRARLVVEVGWPRHQVLQVEVELKVGQVQSDTCRFLRSPMMTYWILQREQCCVGTFDIHFIPNKMHKSSGVKKHKFRSVYLRVADRKGLNTFIARTTESQLLIYANDQHTDEAAVNIAV